jgi:hypothetical protein
MLMIKGMAGTILTMLILTGFTTLLRIFGRGRDTG